jgi:predicted Zn-dependent protease
MPRYFIWCAAILMTGFGKMLAAAPPLNPHQDLLAAFEQLRNGHYAQAIEAAQDLSAANPTDPLPRLLEAQALFELHYCQAGHITSKEVWHVSDVEKAPDDERFTSALNQAVKLSELMKRDPNTAALGHFLNGTAYAFRARLSTLREQPLASGRDGKRMREELLRAIALDESLSAEADVGLGLYDYYADSLSPIIKMLRFILFIPGGNIERGILKLQVAADARNLAAFNNRNHENVSHGSALILLQPEARWELARILGVREGRHGEAVKLLAQLVDHYPDNAIFALLAALEAEAAGNLEVANEFAVKAVDAAARIDPACRPKVEPAAHGAAKRIAEALQLRSATAP